MAVPAMLKRAVLRVAPRFLGPRRFASLAARVGRVANLDLSAAKERQLELYPGAVLDKTKFIPAVFQNYYSGGDSNLVVPGKDVGTAAAYVPYYRGHTSVVLYNFFKANYGIRDPILYRYSIFRGRDSVWCMQFLLSSDQVRHILDPAATRGDLPEHGSVVIEAFHPRIFISSGELRFFGMYRDTEHGHLAGTHSIGLGREGLPRTGQPSFRGFGERNSKHFHHSATAPRSALQVQDETGAGDLAKLRNESGMVTNGYMTRESPSGSPTSIWHDGPTPHFVRPVDSGRRIGASYTAFYVPDFQTHAPLVLVSSSQVGFLPRSVAIRLIAEDGTSLGSKEVSIGGDDATVDLLKLFSDEAVCGGVNVIMDFDRDIGEFPGIPTAYVHLYFRSPGGLGDQAHSASTFGYYDDPFKKPRPYRCRKFAPFLRDNELQFIYSIVNVGPNGKTVRDADIRIRVLTDRGFEFVLTRKLNPAGFTNIRSDDLLDGLPIDIESSAIVQFEHETTNFNGSWFVLNRSTGHLGVDHFTGG